MQSNYRKSRWTTSVAVVLLLGVSVAAAKISNLTSVGKPKPAVTPVVYTLNSPPPVSEAEAARAVSSAKDLSTAFRMAADRVLPSLVTIETTMAEPRGSHPRTDPQLMPDDHNPFEGTPFEEWFSQKGFGRGFSMPRPPQGEQSQHGLGSGVIFDASGLVLTNNHVVAGGEEVVVLVRLSDGQEFTADAVWTDPKTDIAVVRIKGAKDLQAAKLADSDQVAVGDWVLALGQPFGLESTVTAGIISAMHRGVGINARENFLQTDAAINPGNSGGPLVNLDGEVVGINTAISSRGGGNDGVGFAVPINVARWVGEQLVREGRVQRAYLGIGIQQLDAKLAGQFGVQPRQGVLVTEVYTGTPAEKAELKSGDVIVEYAGLSVSSPQELQMVVERSTIGKPHELIVIRDGKRTALAFVPEAQPESFGNQHERNEPARGDQDVSPSRVRSLGIEVTELTKDIARQLGMPTQEGVVITNVEENSPASRAGLESGMVLLEVNQQKVTTIDECEEALADHDVGRELLLRVKSRNGSRFVVVEPHNTDESTN